MEVRSEQFVSSERQQSLSTGARKAVSVCVCVSQSEHFHSTSLDPDRPLKNPGLWTE